MKVELHCHTKETSICGKVEAKELVRIHKEAGYDAVVITDHYNVENIEQFAGSDAEKVDQWLQGYEAVKKEGKKQGLQVFFGIEARLLDCDNDYLLYGMTPEFLYAHPDIHKRTLEEFYKLCQQEGVLVIQAHPFRPGCHLADVRYLNGIEVKNGNPRHDSHNELALEAAAKHPHLIQTIGSDFHQRMDLGRCPMELPWVKNEKELKKALCQK